jgi:hypothetical protein
MEPDEKTGLVLPAPVKRGRTAGIIPVQVEERPRKTFFVRNGNVFILFCWLVVISSFVYIFFSWRDGQKKYLEMFNSESGVHK